MDNLEIKKLEPQGCFIWDHAPSILDPTPSSTTNSYYLFLFLFYFIYEGLHTILTVIIIQGAMSCMEV